ncbi:MAG: DNA polymerase alpha catalytic subunit [Amphiamblys sp. WSBS2006]|nr:MAG: DNA polymerase alpha catalytic subunit [Amphiamblys sp. WSBS2006]
MLTTPGPQKNKIDFYFLDAHTIRNKLHLFGKTKCKDTNEYVSSCVVVENQDRNVFFVPKDNSEHGLGDLEEKINTLAKTHGIKGHSLERVKRKPLFKTADSPLETQCIKMVYPHRENTLPHTAASQTSADVYGSTVSQIETFLVKRRVCGPCWLEIDDAEQKGVKTSLCTAEFAVETPKKISVAQKQKESPPLDILSVSIRTVQEGPQKTKRTIAAIAGSFYKNVDTETQSLPPASSFLLLKAGPGTDAKEAFVSEKEHEIIEMLFAKIKNIDPDAIVSYELTEDLLPTLFRRMDELNIRRHSLGRLELAPSRRAAENAPGRLLCDLHGFVAEHETIKAPSFSKLVEKHLGTKRNEMTHEETERALIDRDALAAMLGNCIEDTKLAAALLARMGVLPLTQQLAVLAGNLWARSLAGSRANRTEYLLLHECHRNKIIYPDKEKTDFSKKRKGYLGGLVLEPKKALYTTITLLLDFNSLYPSIIQEYDICFTTFTPEEAEAVETIAPPETPHGFLPGVLRRLVGRRKEVKKLLASPLLSEKEKKTADIRQKALKLTANSVYGCLGFPGSRFYGKHLASLITGLGRRILRDSVTTVEKLRYSVIYGDTDSVMVDTQTTDMQKAVSIAQNIKREINKKHSVLEIDLENCFKRLLLLQKKKYCALVVKGDETTLETKGIELVRQDWCGLAKDASEYAVGLAMHEETPGAVKQKMKLFLETLGSDALQKKIPFSQFLLTKALSKNPEEYVEGNRLPHVVVALRMKERGLAVFPGQMIPFVVCSAGGRQKGVAQRCYHVDEVTDTAAVDTEWYLANQVLPCVARLSAWVEGLDRKTLAAYLGLGTKYASECTASLFNEDEAEEATIAFDCCRCGKQNIWSASSPPADTCRDCSARFTFSFLYKKILLLLRRETEKVYRMELHCPPCLSAASKTDEHPRRCRECGEQLEELHSAAGLHRKLGEYKAILDQKEPAVLARLSALVSAVAGQSAYPWVDCQALFSFLL